MHLTAHTPDTTPWWKPARILRIVRLYLKLQLIQLRTVVEYRGDFWIGILGATLMHGAGLVFISALFSRIPEIAGWTVWEIAILYGLALIPRGITELLCDGPWTLRGKVNNGEFDRLLVRPVSPALQTATQLASIHGLGQLMLGLVAVLIGASRSGMEWSLWKLGFLLIVVISSSVMLGAINYLVNMIGFWEPSTQSAIPTMYATMIDFAKFPLDMYNVVIHVIVTVVAPYAFVSYFPGLLLLGKDTPWRWMGLATPFATAIVVGITAWLWHKALNRYQGVGH
jgi:ABC-2 type transport system permease protein